MRGHTVTSTNTPRVSIGLPVYNGEIYLAAAVASLLNQTFTNFELIISDNASTDRTEEICRTYAATDKRIRYYRNERNLGAAWNFNRTFELATGPYFMWACHDDVWAPTFIAQCVATLDARPEIILAYTKSIIIDEHGDSVYEYDAQFNTESPCADLRFHDLVRTPHKCFQLLGIIRTGALAKSPLYGNYTSSDIVLLAQLGLTGAFHELPETLFFYRHHAQQSIRIDRFARMAWADPARSTYAALPHWRLFFGLWGCIQQVSLPWGERIRCYITMLCWPAWSRNWRRLGKDLLIAALYLLGSLPRLAREPKKKSNKASA